MKYFIDNRGFRRVESEKKYELLARFLVEDIQNSINWCDELISIINSVVQGELPSWEGTGNAYTLTIDKNNTEITNEYTDESLRDLPNDFFINALTEWKSFLQNSG